MASTDAEGTGTGTGTGPIDRLTAPEGLPDRPSLPRYVAPLPAWLENVGLRIAWVVVGINLLGTLFGFYYYSTQFSATATWVWPVVPDSPVATLFIAASLGAWKLGESREWLNALAFFGCIKLGLWTPYVLLVFMDGFSTLHWAMYNFLFWSHLAMVVEAFLIYRYSDFPVGAVLVAVLWYGLNDMVDYFVEVAGTTHHTLLPVQGSLIDVAANEIGHASPAHEYAAAGAVVLTLSATFLALATRVEKLERGVIGD